MEEILANYERYVGVVLFESSAKAEEIFMDRLGTVTDLLFVGGSSSAADGPPWPAGPRPGCPFP